MKEKIDVRSFFTNSKTVWVSENFQNLLLKEYVSVLSDQKNESVNSSELQNIQTQIKMEELVFQNADTFLEQLALLIQNQIQGEDGRLLNDSSANYFFLKGKDGNYYSVLVRFEQAQKLWRCGAYLQEDLKLPSVRIFYPA
jgi:hypothetical protein